jgi:16S rRNA U1498 N3-methylase RsmE
MKKKLQQSLSIVQVMKKKLQESLQLLKTDKEEQARELASMQSTIADLEIKSKTTNVTLVQFSISLFLYFWIASTECECSVYTFFQF